MPTTTTIRLWLQVKALSSTARTVATLLVALILGGLPQFLLVPPAAAAEPAAFANVDLWVRPEFDDPRLLVMIDGTVAPGTALPTTVRFLVPTGAEMFSAGSIDQRGTYKGGPPNRKASDVAGWDEISYSLTTNQFRVEYYADAIKGLPEKDIAYEFRTLYPINTLNVQLCQPKKATNFAAKPEAQSRATDDFGLPALVYRFTSVTPDKPLPFDISYTKADNAPSFTPSELANPGQAASQGNTNSSIWMVAVVFAVLIAGAAIWFTTNRGSRKGTSYRGARTAQHAARSARPVSSRVPASSVAQRPARSERGGSRIEEKGVFCRKCGSKLEPAGRFCKRCGTRVG